jgi:hypothetical protein
MNEKKIVPTLEEMKREAKWHKKMKVVNSDETPEMTPKQKKKMDTAMKKVIKDKLKDFDIDQPMH